MELSLDFETEITRAKWYKEDLEKGEWSEKGNYPGFIAWTKSFPDEEVPVKVLFKFDLAMPAEYVLKMLDPSTYDTRPGSTIDRSSRSATWPAIPWSSSTGSVSVRSC